MLLWGILFLILSGPGILRAALNRGRYEEGLPLSCAGIMLLLFLCGAAGFLRAGVYVVCALTAGTYLLSLALLAVKKRWRAAAKRVFTPAFFLFLLAYLVLIALNYGRLAASWDEFSHWADVVKAMAARDVFSASPLSQSMFRSYPPAMSLFQYFVQKLNALCTPGAPFFTEWLLYFAYQLFFLSFLFPFLNKLTFDRPLTALLSALFLCAMPLTLYGGVYGELYIDPFLGIVSGAGMAMVLLRAKKGAWYWLYLYAVLCTLVLAKDAGLLLALFILLAAGLDRLLRLDADSANDAGGAVRFSRLRGAGWTLGGAAAIALPKLLWNGILRANGAAKSFDLAGKLDIAALLRVLTHQDATYRAAVWRAYKSALFTQKITLGSTGVTLPYIALAVLLLALLCAVCALLKKRGARRARAARVVFYAALAETLVYIIGLGVTYLFTFSEYEATRLASFGRYINIIFLSCAMLCALALAYLLQKQKRARARRWEIALLCAIALITPWNAADQALSRAGVASSQSVRAPYTRAASKLLALAGGERAKVYIISQATSGFDYWVLRYSLRPCEVSPNFSWSLGEPFYEGDVWTRTLSPRAWIKTLAAENYDYVLLYRVNDYFKERFASVFAQPELIADQTVFRLSADGKQLEACAAP